MVSTQTDSMRAASAPSLARRFLLISVGGGVAGFGLWCAMDFVLLRYAPSRITHFDWALVLFPLAILALGIWGLRHPKQGPCVGLALAAAALATLLSITLVAFFGIPFHFAMGGSL